MIIEFIGLPGSGKSYYADILKDYFKSSNIKTKNINNISRTKFYGKVIRIFLYKIADFHPKLRFYKNKIKGLFKDNVYNNLYNIYPSIDKCLNTISVFIYLYNKLSDKKEVYILDEGLFHYVVKMSANFDIDEKKVLELINEIKLLLTKDGIVIYNYISQLDSKIELKKRNRHVCLFDELKEDDLDNILNKYYEICDIISNNISTVKVDRYECDEEKINRVMKKVKEFA